MQKLRGRNGSQSKFLKCHCVMLSDISTGGPLCEGLAVSTIGGVLENGSTYNVENKKV